MEIPCDQLMASPFDASSSSHSSATRANLYAQELNNSASSCIEIGQYGRALTTLKQALELFKHQENSNGIVPCYCYGCTLAGCIVHTETIPPPLSTEQQHTSTNCYNGSCDSSTSSTEDEISSSSITDYVARRPIKVAARGHVMGLALQLIIIYNIGLAGHLNAISIADSNDRFNKIVHVVIESYRLALELQQNLLQRHHDNSNFEQQREERTQLLSRGVEDQMGIVSEAVPTPVAPLSIVASSVGSVRFEMRIFNNVGQLYKQLDYRFHRGSDVGGINNPGTTFAGQHEQCLRQLLSVIMLVVDHQIRESDSESVISISAKWRLEIEGFLGNIVPLVLKPEYTAVSA